MKTIKLLEKLVSIPSIFPDEIELSEFVGKYLNEKGFKVNKVITGKSRPNIVATFGKADKYLGFYGHLDTVPNNFDERKNPFKMQIDKTIATGLGVEDMKGGIAAILKMGEFAAKNNLPVKLIFGVDEENISKGAHDLVDSHQMDDVKFLIVGEGGQIPKNAQNFSVVFGRKGRILFTADIKGRKAHAAESEKGVNAVSKASDLIKLLSEIKFSKHPRLGSTKIVVHSISGQTDAFSIPDKCHIEFSLLTTPGINSEGFLKDLRKKAKQKDIDVSIDFFKRETPYGESYEIDLENKFLKLLVKEIIENYKVKPIYASSVADENIFANRLKIPVMSLGPLGGGGHTSSEWLDLDSVNLVEQVYLKIISLYHLKHYE